MGMKLVVNALPSRTGLWITIEENTKLTDDLLVGESRLAQSNHLVRQEFCPATADCVPDPWGWAPHRGKPLLDETVALRAWLRERTNDGSDYLFISQKGGKVDRTQFFRVFQSVAAAAGISSEKRHPHVLKHSLASHLVAGNVNLALVRQALGHRSITSTMQYVGTSDGQAAEAAQAALMRVF
jgi:hypothetical protein